MAALRAFDPGAFDPEACVANAERFSVTRFRSELRAAVKAAQKARDNT
jgi:hypothetical protein